MTLKLLTFFVNSEMIPSPILEGLASRYKMCFGGFAKARRVLARWR